MTSPLTLLHDTFRLLTSRSPGPAVRDAWPAYLAFVTLTAPPALLYAIPVERFMTPSAASVTNVWFLAVVAAWRVGLWDRANASNQTDKPKICSSTLSSHPAARRVRLILPVMSFASLVRFNATLRQTDRLCWA